MKKFYSALLICAFCFSAAQNSFPQNVLWSDDFSDGNYTSNWEWTVYAGVASVVNNELKLDGLTPDWYCAVSSRGDTNHLFIPDDYMVTYTTRMTGTSAMGSALAFKVDDVNYYYVLLYSSYIYIVRTVDYIASVYAPQVQVNQNMKVKIQSSGDTVKVRVWTGLFEPTVWDMVYDSCYTSGSLYPDLFAAAWWLDASTSVYFDNFVVYGSTASGVDYAGELPANYSLSQNFPNPFNPATSIRYAIGSFENSGGWQFVSLKIYDVLGNEIKTLVNEEKPAGIYEVVWNPVNLPSGTYFYKLEAGNFAETKKMIFMK
jgi:hypothetical protein